MFVILTNTETETVYLLTETVEQRKQAPSVLFTKAMSNKFRNLIEVKSTSGIHPKMMS